MFQNFHSILIKPIFRLLERIKKIVVKIGNKKSQIYGENFFNYIKIIIK